MKSILTTTLFTLLALGSLLAQAPEIGLATTDAYLYKYVMPKKSMLAPKSNTIDMNQVVAGYTNYFTRAYPDLTTFSDPLTEKINRLAPKWLATAGAEGVAQMDASELSESEMESYNSFYMAYVMTEGAMSGGLGINIMGKQMRENNMVVLKDEANKLGDRMDRDYVMIIDFAGSHWVKEKFADEPIDYNDLQGYGRLTVSIFDSATGLHVVSVASTIGNGQKPKSFDEAEILADLEKMVGKAYSKFLKKVN